MRTISTRHQNRPALNAEQRRRAERLTRRLTVFASFAELCAYYRDLPGGYRGSLKAAAPALLAGWTNGDRRAERAEHDLALNLAHLVDLAEASAPRRIVVVSASRRAA